MRTIGLILAGGRGSRMGSPGPKPLLDIAGRRMIERVAERLRGHVDRILVSANEPEAFAALGFDCVPDRVAGHAGPLAGLDAAAGRLDEQSAGPFRVLSVPGDTPFLPFDLVPRLLAAQADEPDMIVVPQFAGRLQPATALWPAGVLRQVGAELVRPGASRSLRSVIEPRPHRALAFAADPGAPGGDPFFNVNTPDDLRQAVLWAETVDETLSHPS